MPGGASATDGLLRCVPTVPVQTGHLRLARKPAAALSRARRRICLHWRRGSAMVCSPRGLWGTVVVAALMLRCDSDRCLHLHGYGLDVCGRSVGAFVGG